MLENVEAIIFDLGGVILNLDYNRTINAFKELGKENFEKLYTQSNQDKIFDRFETGVVSSTEFRNYMKSFLEEDISDDLIDQAWNSMLLDLPAERIELLKNLKRKYKLFLFSNTNEIHYKTFRKNIALSYDDENLLESIFNQTYYSHLVGMRKPNANAFQKVLTDHQLFPQTTLFIDDSVQHIEGAKQLGIQAIHLNKGTILDVFQKESRSL